jgi:hypothetical protein
MNAHDQLERQLRASVAQIADRAPGLRPWGRSWSQGLSAVIVAATTAVALGVAVIAEVALHRGRPPSSKPSVPVTTTTGPSRLGPRPRDPGPIPRNVDDAAVAAAWNTAWREDPTCRPGAGGGPGAGVSYGAPSAAMLSTLPILRRPASSADRLPANLYFHSGGRLKVLLGGQGGDVYIRYVRRVRVAEGRTFYLVPVAKIGRPPVPPAAANRCYRLEIAALQAELPSVPRAKRAPTRRYGDAEFALGRYNLETSTVHEGVALIEQNINGGGGGGGAVQGLESIQQGGQLGGGGGGKPPTPIMMDGIVPSGVATVTLQFPAIHHRSQHLPALNATGEVVNNVFVIPVPTLFERGGWPTTAIWRSASGKVIKTVDERPFHP